MGLAERPSTQAFPVLFDVSDPKNPMIQPLRTTCYNVCNAGFDVRISNGWHSLSHDRSPGVEPAYREVFTQDGLGFVNLRHCEPPLRRLSKNWPAAGWEDFVRKPLRILTVLVFLCAAAFSLWGLGRSLMLQDFNAGIAYRIGHGVGLLSILLMAILLWGSWRSDPPRGRSE